MANKLSFEFAQKVTFWEQLPGHLSISNYVAAILKKTRLYFTRAGDSGG